MSLIYKDITINITMRIIHIISRLWFPQGSMSMPAPMAAESTVEWVVCWQCDSNIVMITAIILQFWQIRLLVLFYVGLVLRSLGREGHKTAPTDALSFDYLDLNRFQTF